MSETVERHSRISITQSGLDGVTRTEVRVSEMVSAPAAYAGTEPYGGTESPQDDDPGACRGTRFAEGHAFPHNPRGAKVSCDNRSDDRDCFDPISCCSARERAMIAALKAYLRPDQAPDCLITRLKAVLDDCCGCGR